MTRQELISNFLSERVNDTAIYSAESLREYFELYLDDYEVMQGEIPAELRHNLTDEEIEHIQMYEVFICDNCFYTFLISGEMRELYGFQTCSAHCESMLEESLED